MGRKPTLNLPKHQTVQIHDKFLWESIRIISGLNQLNIYELVDIGMRYFMQSEDVMKSIELYKVQKGK